MQMLVALAFMDVVWGWAARHTLPCDGIPRYVCRVGRVRESADSGRPLLWWRVLWGVPVVARVRFVEVGGVFLVVVRSLLLLFERRPRRKLLLVLTCTVLR